MAAVRRLAGILAANVVGYSRLIGRGEEGTLARLRALFREVVQPTVTQHRGRVFKLIGDSVRYNAACSRATKGRELT